eukprot:6800954-Pyramimonas_sp.AAC.1
MPSNAKQCNPMQSKTMPSNSKQRHAGSVSLIWVVPFSIVPIDPETSTFVGMKQTGPQRNGSWIPRRFPRTSTSYGTALD